MAKYYDITNPDKAYEWLYSIFDIDEGHLIEEYILKCNNDFDEFFDLHIAEIESIDINKLEIIAIHVTSNNDECQEIKKNGLQNLKRVLAEKTELNVFLMKNGISFDIVNEKMYINENEYDINYEKLKNLNSKTTEDKNLERIAHKIYYDYQVNGFLFNRDIFDYGTGIDKHPEFLVTLSDFSGETKGLVSSWDYMNQGYVIKYKSHVKDFEFYTFYESVEEYLNDANNKWINLKYWLISRAIDCCFTNISSQVFAYMKPSIVVKPERILECIPVEEWRKDVSKYFE